MPNPPTLMTKILGILADGQARSTTSLANLTGTTQRAVWSSLHRLQQKGTVTKIVKPGERIRYTLPS